MSEIAKPSKPKKPRENYQKLSLSEIRPSFWILQIGEDSQGAREIPGSRKALRRSAAVFIPTSGNGVTANSNYWQSSSFVHSNPADYLRVLCKLFDPKSVLKKWFEIVCNELYDEILSIVKTSLIEHDKEIENLRHQLEEENKRILAEIAEVRENLRSALRSIEGTKTRVNPAESLCQARRPAYAKREVNLKLLVQGYQPHHKMDFLKAVQHHLQKFFPSSKFNR
uniref:Uncharacterized protein n=1 Tax=Ditylenchus dipsaci TaxID=166011 RepID=A0A915EWY2_9BILA